MLSCSLLILFSFERSCLSMMYLLSFLPTFFPFFCLFFFKIYFTFPRQRASEWRLSRITLRLGAGCVGGRTWRRCRPSSSPRSATAATPNCTRRVTRQRSWSSSQVWASLTYYCAQFTHRLAHCRFNRRWPCYMCPADLSISSVIFKYEIFF